MTGSPIDESALRDVLLLRAAEQGAPQAGWTDEDRAEASRDALSDPRTDAADPRSFITTRARIAAPRLLNRDPAMASAYRLLVWRDWVGPVLIVAGFVLGALADTLTRDRQINLLAPPLIGLLLWNLLIYLGMIGDTVGTLLRAGAGSGGPIARAVGRFAHGLPPIARFEGRARQFVDSWVQASRRLTGARVAGVLHAGAAALALGAMLTLYVKGIAFEYRAGWESTFLDAPAVTGLLNLILSPASLLSGISLPDAQGMAALRFNGQDGGENAARWIHLYAITLTLFVVIPRIVLAVLAAARARRMARDMPVDFDDPYFDSFARQLRGEAAQLAVIPYSVRIDDAQAAVLARSLRQLYGPHAAVQLRETVAFGDEDEYRYDADAGSPAAALAAVVFPISATPERENHGEFIVRLRAQLPRATELVVLVDDSSFKARFSAQPERLEQRRAAWRKTLAAVGCHPVFVSLIDDQVNTNAASLREALSRLKTDAATPVTIQHLAQVRADPSSNLNDADIA